MDHNWQKQFVLKTIDSKLIKGARSLSSEEALLVYYQDYQARMLEALGKNYEATWVMLGDEEFFQLANDFIEKFPSKHFSLNQFGENFPEFLAINCDDSDIFLMSDYERNFWKLFHQDANEKKILKQEDIEKGLFDLSQIYFFESNVDLQLIFKNRESGISEDLKPFINESKRYALYKMNNIVKVLELNLNQFHFLKELKDLKSFLKVKPIPLKEEDWPIIFEVLSFSKTH